MGLCLKFKCVCRLQICRSSENWILADDGSVSCTFGILGWGHRRNIEGLRNVYEKGENVQNWVLVHVVQYTLQHVPCTKDTFVQAAERVGYHRYASLLRDSNLRRSSGSDCIMYLYLEEAQKHVCLLKVE